MATAKIYLPKGATSDELLTEVQRTVCEEFGGFTMYDARGGWEDEDGEIVKEKVHAIETSVEVKEHHSRWVTENGMRSTFRKLAKKVINETDEDAVMWVLNGEPHFERGA